MTRALLAAPALLVLGLSAASARDEEPATIRSILAPTVSVVEATRRETVATVTVTGTLVPRDEVLVTPEIDGYRVAEVLVEEGARVAKGQVLARLARDLIDRQIAQQDAVVAKAEAAVLQSQSNIEQAEAAETEARLGLERARSLMATGNTTAVVMETRTSALRQAEGKLAFARNGLVMAKADLTQARAARDELSLRLARTEIRAPEAGIVSRRSARVGLAASSTASEPLFRLIARGEIELEGEVVETKLPLLREGVPAWIELGDGSRVAGRVRAVYPEVDKATRLGKVRVRLDPDPRLRIGTFARGGVELARSRGVSVPQASVLYGGGRRSVLVVSGDRVEDRTVRTGIADEDTIEVRAGLNEGERVVARAGSFLRDGDRVRPVLEASGSPPATATMPALQESAEAGVP